MAIKKYLGSDYTGGTTGCLDAIDVSNTDGSGTNLADGDVCEIVKAGIVTEHYFDADSGAAESSPGIVKPDKSGGAAYTGDGRWVLSSIRVEDLTVDGDATVGGDLDVTGDAGVTGALTAGSVSAGTVAAPDGDGLGLRDDGGNGIFVEDGGNVGFGTDTPHYGGASYGGRVVTIDGGASRGVLELAVGTDTDAEQVGIIGFINTANANDAAATRPLLAQIQAVTETSDANAGEDSGGELQFHTKAEAGAIAKRMSISSAGVVNVVGEITAGTKTFKIDHPLTPKEKILYHMAIEGPRVDLIYRGIATLADGRAVVDLDRDSTEHPMTPGTFAALTQNAVVSSLQNQTGFDRLQPGKIEDGKFEIVAESPDCTDAVAWAVMAERADPFIKSIGITDAGGRLVPEADKDEPDLSLLDGTTETTSVKSDDGKTRTEPIDLFGKGYAIHKDAYAEAWPTRTVTKKYVEPESKEGL